MKIKQLKSQSSRSAGLFFKSEADLQAAPLSVFGPIHLGAGQYRRLHSFHSEAFIIVAMRTPFVRRYSHDPPGLRVVRRGSDRRSRSKMRLALVYRFIFMRAQLNVAPDPFFDPLAL
jgi:hypothetical protein